MTYDAAKITKNIIKFMQNIEKILENDSFDAMESSF